MKEKELHHYNENHLPTSAKEIVPIVMDLVSPNSVVDVGCGLGQWLGVFNEYGVKKNHGIDGGHVLKEKMFISEDYFEEYRLENSDRYEVLEKFDLAICLEVAEHLDEKCSNGIVKMLTSLSDIVLFSAAIIGQTGENHLNEQNPDFWVKKFSERGFVFIDPFRKAIWRNENINWWYRQNLYLVVHKSHPLASLFPLDENLYIHPGLFNFHLNKSLSFMDLMKGNGDIMFILKVLLKTIFVRLKTLK
jgi:SAM-dependent methyltransferase